MAEIIHDLTILYLQTHDFKSLSPEELYDQYKKIYDQIKTHKDSKKNPGVSVLK